MSGQGSCCGCLCSRSTGARIVLVYMAISPFVIGNQMVNQFGPDAYPYMIPIIANLLVMTSILFTVLCVPGFNTEKGRYLIFAWWWWTITWAWNLYWWYMLFVGINGETPEKWDCKGKGLAEGTQAFKDCLEKSFWEQFPPGVFMFGVDLWVSLELYLWQRDAKDSERQPMGEESDLEMQKQ